MAFWFLTFTRWKTVGVASWSRLSPPNKVTHQSSEIPPTKIRPNTLRGLSVYILFVCTNGTCMFLLARVWVLPNKHHQKDQKIP